ncbi:unnamed protein product [Linum tenue]|uniref:RPW8 domain-containing protein n=1 Tax=Linum tenue TaxID=586396 RepID=A0AAV0L5L1_9ROSI|nr:unnamed protein product [Linum tenue]
MELVFGTFLKVIFELKKTNSQFEPTQKLLEETLKNLSPDINRIDGYNRDFDRPDEMAGLKELMTKAEKLVLKCSNIGRYNIFKRYFHAKKLLELNDSIPLYISVMLSKSFILKSGLWARNVAPRLSHHRIGDCWRWRCDSSWSKTAWSEPVITISSTYTRM